MDWNILRAKKGHLDFKQIFGNEYSYILYKKITAELFAASVQSTPMKTM